MPRIASLRRPLLIIGGLLILVDVALCITTAPNRDPVQTILPRWADYIGIVGLMLIVLAQGIAAATRQGWQRLRPVVALVLVLPFAVLLLGLVSLLTQRVEMDRVTLPDGRVVMMTLEPSSDTIFALWVPHGWRWREFLDGVVITYSEDGSFTRDPGLVLTKDGQYLLVRRGGIWTDCFTTAANPRSCSPPENDYPLTRAEWLDRSARIAATAGVDPS